jgi:hypothetical protein
LSGFFRLSCPGQSQLENPMTAKAEIYQWRFGPPVSPQRPIGVVR